MNIQYGCPYYHLCVPRFSCTTKFQSLGIPALVDGIVQLLVLTLHTSHWPWLPLDTELDYHLANRLTGHDTNV